MRNILTGTTLAVGLAFVALPASAAPFGAGYSGMGEGAVQHAQYGGGRECERLRRACELKEERGEAGEGNCRRYRERCGRESSYCARLKRACYNKEERGETGEGNCRHWRSECGGGRG